MIPPRRNNPTDTYTLADFFQNDGYRAFLGLTQPEVGLEKPGSRKRRGEVSEFTGNAFPQTARDEPHSGEPKQARGTEMDVSQNPVLALALNIASRGRVDSAQPVNETLRLAARGPLLKEMEQIAERASVENWNDDGARLLDPNAYRLAISFALLLPVTVEDPEPSADADGAFSFEWYRGPRRVFSVSVDGFGTLYHAGLFGQNYTNGAETLEDRIPEAVALGLARVLREDASM